MPRKTDPIVHTKEYRDNKERIPLVEPIYRQQPEESDRDYQLFLIYRDIAWDERSAIKASAIAQNIPESQVKESHSAIRHASMNWQWPKRVAAYDLFLQEHQSDRQERIVLQTKSDIEHCVMRLVGKIKRIENIQSVEDLNDPALKKDMAVVQAMLDKGGAGKFLLDAYKTIVGQKVIAGGMKPISEIQFKALEV